jgi:hypothetical protein
MKHFFVCGLIIMFSVFSSFGQKTMTLNEAIKIASDSSLMSFKAQNLYLSNYWEFHSYIAQKKPSLLLSSSIIDYNRALTKVYNSEKNINEYTQQKNIYSYVNASVNQYIPFTGGTIYFDTELSRLQNFGINKYIQFSSIPIRIGVFQPIYGYNVFKWQKKIEPLKFEKAKKDYIKSTETISSKVVDYYFDLLVAKIKFSMATTNVSNSDSLYKIGLNRLEIASLSLADVSTLRVELLTARNELSDAKKQLKNTQNIFNSFLRLNEDEIVDLKIPEVLPTYQLNSAEVLQIALSNNPDLIEFHLQVLESESQFEKIKRQRLFNATLNASLGLNQQSTTITAAYLNPMDQQRGAISLSIPIIDWGQGKGNMNVAKRNLEISRLTEQQAYSDFRQQVLMAVINFNSQFDIVESSNLTKQAATEAYELNRQRFIIGKADVYSLSLALNRQDQANLNYLQSLRLFWKYYFNIRELTLYDFVKKENLLHGLDELIGLM